MGFAELVIGPATSGRLVAQHYYRRPLRLVLEVHDPRVAFVDVHFGNPT
jgi:hypothetical protein